MSFDEALDRMAAAMFDPEKVKMENVAGSGGAVNEANPSIARFPILPFLSKPL